MTSIPTVRICDPDTGREIVVNASDFPSARWDGWQEVDSEDPSGSASNPAEGPYEWPLKTSPEDYLARYANEYESQSEIVRERIELAQRIVGDDDE